MDSGVVQMGVVQMESEGSDKSGCSEVILRVEE